MSAARIVAGAAAHIFMLVPLPYEPISHSFLSCIRVSHERFDARRLLVEPYGSAWRLSALLHNIFVKSVRILFKRPFLKRR